LTFNCPANGATPIIEDVPFPQSVGLAVADTIMGPYTVLTPDHPLTDGNDGTLFLDTDGRVYLYSAVEHKGFTGIACSEVNLVQGSVIGSAVECVPAGGASDWDGGAKVAIEGPSVLERNGTYYMLYASWRRGYEVGYATAKSPRGPWNKYSGNPIYGAQDPEWCKLFNGTYTQSADVPFGQVGHGSPFFGPDGRIWFCCHGIEQKGKGRDTEPHLVIAPMDFRSDGSIAMKLTWTPQTVPVPARVADSTWRNSGTPASATPQAAAD
jgi:beta-xylosidase